VSRSALRRALALALLLAGRAGAAELPPPRVLDSFDTSTAWSAVPASGVEMKLSTEPSPHGNALRVDFKFTKGGGYAVLHRALDLELPENYRFEYRLRGKTPPQNLEFKLIDASGENVWWLNRVDFEYPPLWTTDRIRKRQISFAWGPKPEPEPRHIAALEFAITAGAGGEGTVWFDELTLVPLPAPSEPPAPVASASSSAPAHPPALALDSLAGTQWESDRGDAAPALTLDLGTSREFGGLVLDWGAGLAARDYVVELDDGDGRWRIVREVHDSDGGRDWLDLPESEARRLRVRTLAGRADRVALAEARIMPLAWGATAEKFLTAVALDSPRGHYPRGFLGEQSYWTVVGVDGDPDEGLLDEDGRLETGRAQFSLEPWLLDEHGLRTWADGRTEQSLAQGSLPIPTATRFVDSLALAVTVFARGERGHSALVARYRLRNLGVGPRSVTLLIALRPFQVNPPSQFLNVAGGPARITSLALDGSVVRVNGGRGVTCLTPPEGFGAMTFDQGDLVSRLATGGLPAATHVDDPTGRASGVLRWKLELPPRVEKEVQLYIPFGAAEQIAIDSPATVWGWQQQEEARWRAALGTFALSAGGPGADVTATVEAQLGFVLVNRDGPGIQPGSRAYERSWIRDGSLTSSALLHSGMVEPVRAYIEWYATHQYDDGKVPCCVDRRGSDPVPENDSQGELVFLAAEYLRLGGDRAVVEKLWPHVRAAVSYMDTLRAQRRTAEWRKSKNAPYFGLMPPSISHEGYSAKPMHSYWDDLFALRGYKDGAWLATELGHADDAHWMARSRDQFANDFAAAAKAAMKLHGIRYLPGCSDLGDFDATSTTIALFPVQAANVLPEAALEFTFERYWDFFKRRRSGQEAWSDYTPYELRNVGAFVALGWRERADSLLTWFMADRRPLGWRQWAEVVDRDYRHARFIGDMPHTWVGTDFVRSVQAMLAYEREADSSLVIAAGIPESWLADSGVVVRGLQTRWGTLGYQLTRANGELRLAFDGSRLRVPPGGIYFQPPGLATPRKVLGITVVNRATPVLVDGRMERSLDPSYWKLTHMDRNRMPHVIVWGHEVVESTRPNY
jgi:hypothetical protein